MIVKRIDLIYSSVGRDAMIFNFAVCDGELMYDQYTEAKDRRKQEGYFDIGCPFLLLYEREGVRHDC